MGEPTKGDVDAGEQRASITIPVPGIDGAPDRDVSLSVAAYRLHVYATVIADTEGAPGFVSDDYLAAVTVDVTATTEELVAVGLWQRRSGGYAVLDAKTVEFAGVATRWAERVEAVCLNGLGHSEDPWAPGRCALCHGPMPAENGPQPSH